MSSWSEDDTLVDRATAASAALQNLIQVKEHMTQLDSLLQESCRSDDSTKALIDAMLENLSTALSVLNAGEAPGASQSPAAACSDDRRSDASGGNRRIGIGLGPIRRATSRKRSHQAQRQVTARTLDDGQSWRKYGQKLIQNSTHPRSYFRCTHRPEQGCMATRQVQLSESDPSMYVISYFGEHTCRDPSTIPLIIETSAARDSQNLISFASHDNKNMTSTAHHFMQEEATKMRCPSFHSFTPECTSEEVLSNLTPSTSPAEPLFMPAAAVGSAGAETTVGSAPDRGETATMLGSFPSSPGSLGFMVGSFEDDIFDFDL